MALYYLLILTTSVRFIDIIYLLSRDSTNLPVPVIIVTSVMILYGVYLAVKKIASIIRMKELLTFYMIQTAMIVFNLVYTAVASPLQINALETVVVGTFLDLLINAGLITLVLRQMRAAYEPSVHSMAAGSR